MILDNTTSVENLEHYAAAIKNREDPFCPKCSSLNIQIISEIDSDLHVAYEIVGCSDCSAQWRNYYYFQYAEMLPPDEYDQHGTIKEN